MDRQEAPELDRPGAAEVDRQGEAEVEGQLASVCLFITVESLSSLLRGRGSQGGLRARGSVLKHENALTWLTF